MKSGIIQLNEGPQPNVKTPDLGVNFVNEVVDKLKPILENLVTKTLQDLMKRTLPDTSQHVPDQSMITTLHNSSPQKNLLPPLQANQAAEDDWDAMYMDIEQDQPTTTPSCHESQEASSVFRTTTSVPQSYPLSTLPALSHSSPTLPTPPTSTPCEEPPIVTFSARELTPPCQALLCNASVLPVIQAGRNPEHTLDEALTCMSQLLKVNNATWSCNEQRVAMQAVLECKNDVLAIMRTSSGKSMLMVVPSLLETNSITIGIVPLNSLLLDYSRKFKVQGIPFQIFHSNDSPTLLGNQNLVLTTVDQARTKSWKQQIGELNQRIPVARVVFDEGHYAITDHDFRGVLDDVHELRQFAVQLVVLSATIPPKSEVTIREAFGMMEGSLVVRTPTCRPELQYIVEDPLKCNSDIADRVEAIIRDAQQSLKKEDRILVFVPFIDNGVNLAQQLDCDFFRGGRNTSSQEKENMYQNWVQGVHQVMVCTNAFGAGNDYSHVPLVIHAGTPRHMMGYIQESSRAGRNKQPSKCIILPRKGGGKPLRNNEIDHKGEEDMYEMLYGKHKEDCINYALSRFNDGTGVRCFNSWNRQKCSRCIGFKTTAVPSKGQ